MKDAPNSTPIPLWAGRFREPLTELAKQYSYSLDLDSKLFEEDITGSMAHARMLGECAIITKEEASIITETLAVILSELKANGIPKDSGCEDIHSLIEQLLISKIGELGKKLHTARSRNDQVALDEKLYLRRVATDTIALLNSCIKALVNRAEECIDILMPGFTHLQHAQPVLLSQHLLAYASMFGRDKTRFEDLRRRADISPLGAAAFAGTPFPIDRKAVATELGFSGIVANSIDAVSDRDHLIEFLSACSITMMHLSRFAEEFVLWSTSEFNFISFPDSLCTGSSIMPQKKNPDMAELIRGKVGLVYGSLVSLLTTMKALPLAYNRDMQEDKEPFFKAVEVTMGSIAMATELIEGAIFNREAMKKQLASGFLTATELADHLVAKGLPFRDAHHVTGAAVGYCVAVGKELHELSLEELQQFSPLIDSDTLGVLIVEGSTERKRSAGSTSTIEVKKQLASWKAILQ